MTTTSFSRLGSAGTYDTALRNITQRQSTMSDLMDKNTAGKKIVRASDDPTGAAQAERALTRLSRISTDQRALDAQRNSITVAESTLGDVTDALDKFRTLVVSAGNGTNSAADLKTIAMQLTGLRDQIFNLSNTKDTNGQPLFGALGSALTPFVGPQSIAPDYTFLGLPGQTASTEVSIPFALDGDSAFMLQSTRDGVYNVNALPTSTLLLTSSITVKDSTLVTTSSFKISNMIVAAGTLAGTSTVTYDLATTTADVPPVTSTQVGLTEIDYPSGPIPITKMPGLALSITGTPTSTDTVQVDASTSLFSVLDKAIRDIGTAPNNTAATQAVSQALNNIDIGMGRVSAVRGQAGELLNRADSITSNQDKRSLQLEADRSRAEDLDMVKGISDFQKQQTGYQVALQSYAQIQKLSLFNYIS